MNVIKGMQELDSYLSARRTDPGLFCQSTSVNNLNIWLLCIHAFLVWQFIRFQSLMVILEVRTYPSRWGIIKYFIKLFLPWMPTYGLYFYIVHESVIKQAPMSISQCPWYKWVKTFVCFYIKKKKEGVCLTLTDIKIQSNLPCCHEFGG